MRVLVVKTSSLGDVIHTLPALTDAVRAQPGIVFDWAVEEAFAEVPAWHHAVSSVIPVAIRRWRKNVVATLRSGELQRSRLAIRAANYDLVIDAQGLLKSAWVARWANSPIAGLDRESVREPLAALAYRHRFAVPRQLHAVERVRALFAQALGYPQPTETGDYGLDKSRFPMPEAIAGFANGAPLVTFLHGTTRAAKHWPELYWQMLCERVTAAGCRVLLPWGNPAERERAERIAAISPEACVLPRLDLRSIAGVLLRSRALVAVDTGLAHLAAALDVPAVALYGPTSPLLVGTYGRHQLHLQAKELPPVTDPAIQPPEMAPLTPDRVWGALAPLLDDAR